MREHIFYGRRQGRRMTVLREDALQNDLPKFLVDCPEDIPAHTLDPMSLFDGMDVDEIWLEIGFGNGEHLAEQAKKHPNIGMIGCEPFMNGVSKLLTSIEEEKLSNIRIFPDDARLLMDGLTKDSLSRCFVLHPDPWPKKRHQKRRFIQTERLDKFAELMKKGSELRLATDDADLADWMLEKAYNHSDFEWQANSADDWRIRPDDWPETRYGQKQLAGQPVYFKFLKL